MSGDPCDDGIEAAASKCSASASASADLRHQLNRTAFDFAKELIVAGRLVFDERDAWSDRPSAQTMSSSQRMVQGICEFGDQRGEAQEYQGTAPTSMDDSLGEGEVAAFKDFGNANSSTWGSHAPAPVTSARRAPSDAAAPKAALPPTIQPIAGS
jgi:hypothetical protein